MVNSTFMKKILVTFGCLILFSSRLLAQQAPFNLYLEPLNVSGLTGLQAYAFGQHNNKWLILGGRLDGLHRRQPFAAFDVAGNNTNIIVVDPIAQQFWTASSSSLPVALQEQLSSTNMEFHQEGDYLYVIGGYGYNNASTTKMTFSFLTAVNVPAVIDAVINGSSFVTAFRQISDPDFAVSGGHLKKINDTYYLVGGNRFDGDYNPMGHSTYTQVYTNAIRKFNISDDGVNLQVTHLPSHYDSLNLHRRDYNAAPQIFPDGTEGITAFSGVFQPTVNLPYLNCVNIDSLSYSVNNSFQQFYNHYHCAVLPVYSASANEMHTVFFGGIAQYYDNSGVLIQDNNVPFVKTIARVTRNASGNMAEYKLPVEMPAYLGAGSEFISAQNIPVYGNEVVKLDDLTSDTTMVGYIFGGISSSAPNIFFTNTGAQSSASNGIFKVFLIKNAATGVHDLNESSTNELQLVVISDPASGDIALQFELPAQVTVTVKLWSLDGKEMDSRNFDSLVAGKNEVHFTPNVQSSTGTYLLNFITPFGNISRRIIMRKFH